MRLKIVGSFSGLKLFDRSYNFSHFFSDRLYGEDDVADVPPKLPSDSDISGAYRDQALGSSHPGPAHCPRYPFVSFSGCICPVASTTWSPTPREVPLGDSAEQQGPIVVKCMSDLYKYCRYHKLSQGLGMLEGAPVWTILVTTQYSSSMPSAGQSRPEYRINNIPWRIPGRD